MWRESSYSPPPLQQHNCCCRHRCLEKHDFEVFCPSMRNPTFEGQESGPGVDTRPAAISSYFKIKPCLYCALRMALRNRGCVNEASSPSAWPLDRFQQKNKYLPGFWEVDQPFLNGKEIAGVVNSPRGSPLVGTHEKPNDDNVSFRATLFAKMFLKFYLLT